MSGEQSPKPIRLYDLSTGECIGEITEEQLNALIEAFEEESLEDRDYYVHSGNSATDKRPPIGCPAGKGFG